MHKHTLILGLLCISFLASSQEIRTDTTYYNGTEIIEFSDGPFTSFEVCEVDKKGRRMGNCNRFSKSGKMVEYSHYKNQILQGEYMRFSPLEAPMIKGWYTDGKKDGIWLTYDVAGNPLNFTIYKEDEITLTRSADISQDLESVDSLSIEEPEFSGGKEGWMKFLSNNLQYPLWAKRYGIEGEVHFETLITKEGIIADVIIVESPAEILSREAIRVMRLSPSRVPKKVNGEPVDSYHKMMFTFRLK